MRSDFLSPTYFFEYNGSSMSRVPDPPNAGGVPYIGRMMLLPTGQILFVAETNAVYVYNYFACPSASAKPHITSAPHTVRPFHSYTLHGRLLNGLSQAVGYGDDASGATNYPILRIRHHGTGKVTYCRSFDHSSMGVATGASIESTTFVIPWGTPEGASDIVVVANGIASEPWPVCVEEFCFHWPIFDDAIFARLIGSLSDGPLWVWGPHGPIPVDPWGPKVAAEASGARKMIVTGLMTLRKLGGELQANRQKIAIEAPLAPDDDDLVEEEVTRKEASKVTEDSSVK